MAMAAAGCCRTAALKEEVEAEELKYGADFGFRSSEKNKLDNVPSDPLSKYGRLWAGRRGGRQTRRQAAAAAVIMSMPATMPGPPHGGGSL